MVVTVGTAVNAEQGGVVAVNRELKLTKSTAKLARQPMDLPLAQVPLGQVHVIAERCKQCSFCIDYCPTDVLIYSDDVNAKGYHYPIVAEGKESACVDCCFCDLICPEMAIYTTEVSDDEDKGEKSDAG